MKISSTYTKNCVLGTPNLYGKATLICGGSAEDAEDAEDLRSIF